MEKRITHAPHGPVRMPASKSVAHRAIMCAAHAGGMSVLRGVTPSLDIEATVRAMRALGASIQWVDGELVVEGGERTTGAVIDCGESGTTLRFAIPLAALRSGAHRLTGRGRLMQRPLTPYLDELARHGMHAALEGDILTIEGPPSPGHYELPGDISSQYVSGLLLALPMLAGDSDIVTTTPLQSASYAHMTVDVMRVYGVNAESEDDRFHIPGGQRYTSGDMEVEGDYSQAAFFLCAAALGCDVECRGLSPVSRQGDRRILDILEECGARIALVPEGGLRVTAPDGLRGVSVDAGDIPDLVPPLAALLCCCDGDSRIENAGRLRHKESDRLQSVTQGLAALGADIRIEGDAIAIRGRERLAGGFVQTHGDHRIAMMAAVAAIRCDGDVVIDDADCVAKSYPHFWRDFETVAREELPHE